MFETNLSGHNKIWRYKKIWAALPSNAPLWLWAYQWQV